MPANSNAQSKEFVIVVNSNAQFDQLNQKQVMSLFLGRSKFFPSGNKVKAIDYPVDSSQRAAFYQALTGKNIAAIDAYWARLKYSGRVNSPQPLADSQQIIKAVSEEPGTIAYLPVEAQALAKANGLKTVLTMNSY